MTTATGMKPFPNLLETGPDLSMSLCIEECNLRRRYEDRTMHETPLYILMGVMVLSSLAWIVTMVTFASELSTWSTVAMFFTCTPFVFGFLYCYAVWIFQTNEILSSSAKLTSFNQFVIEHICCIGSAMVLLNAFSFVITVMIHDDNSKDDGDALMAFNPFLEYQHVWSLVVIPVMFPMHSCAVSILVLPMCFFVQFLFNTGTPLSAVQMTLSFTLVLYLVNIGNKKRVLFQLEYEDVKSALMNAEERIQEIETQRTDMHHMIGSMAHDLKTPLQAFTFELDNLSAECKKLLSTPGQLHEFKILMDKNFTQLHTIISFMSMAINRSLDYTKVNTGVELVPSMSRVDLTETTAWIMASLTHKLRNTVSIVVEPVPGDISACVLTDKQWLIENIFCFLSNALKFTSEGQITVRFVLQAPLEGGEKSVHEIPMLVIEVEDTGIGLSDVQKERLFRPFQQAQRRAGGTGLGLFSLLKRVSSLGGECGVRDRLNNQNGSIFWFSIPYIPDTPIGTPETLSCNTSPESTSSPIDTVMPHTQYRRILVVDDSVLIQKATKRSLEREGYLVDVADNGYECLKMINSQEHQYDLILLDLNMPIMDGLETVTRLRSQEFKSRFGYVEEDSEDGDQPIRRVGSKSVANVVVGFSANSDAATKAEALEAGMDAFLCKPLSAKDLKTLSTFMNDESV